MYSKKTYKRLSLVLLVVSAIMVLAALGSGILEFWLGSIAGVVAAACFGLCSLLANDAPGAGSDEYASNRLYGAHDGMPKHNPANGLDMVDGVVDVHGNPYGIDDQQSHLF